MNLFEYDEFKNLSDESDKQNILKVILENLTEIRIFRINPTDRGLSRLIENGVKISDILWKLGVTKDKISPFMFKSESLWKEFQDSLIMEGIFPKDQKDLSSPLLIGLIILRNRTPQVILQSNLTSISDLVSLLGLVNYIDENNVTIFISVYYPEFHDIDFKN